MRSRRLTIGMLAVVFAGRTLMALRLAAEHQACDRNYEYARRWLVQAVLEGAVIPQQ